MLPILRYYLRLKNDNNDNLPLHYFQLKRFNEGYEILNYYIKLICNFGIFANAKSRKANVM